MFFIEDNIRSSSSSLGKTTEELKDTSEKLTKKFKDASYLHGVALGKNPIESKTILESHGYTIEKPEDMVNAVADLLHQGGEKWQKFSEQFKPFLEKTIEAEMSKKPGDESNATGGGGGGANPISAIATAVGNIVGGITGVAASAKNRDAAKEGARGELYKGMFGVMAEKEKRKSAKQNQIVWVIVGIVVIAVVGIIAYVMMNRKKAA